MSRRLIGLVGIVCALVGLAAACASSPQPSPAVPTGALLIDPPDALGLQAVELPDFFAMEEPVRRQMQARYDSLSSRVESANPTPADLASAYGEMGKLLMAATYYDAAETCYLNAQTLAPGDRRWPYYLGHVYKARGPLEKAAASFERALELGPSDVATLVWLGEVYLAQGRPERAEPLFAKALTLQPGSSAALFGRGRVALATKEHGRAVRDLEEALALTPHATAIHYPLAMAARGLGDLPKAEVHLRQQGHLEPRPPDPLMDDIDGLLESAEAYDVRGGRALDAGNWAVAADYFRQGLELDPANASLRHRLGTALFQMGDVRGAAEQFEQVIRTSPEHARAHFSLGVLRAAGGAYEEAIERFSAAVKHEPGYVQARVELAGALSRGGRPAEALPHYEQALQADPRLWEAAFGYAMALVRLHRYQAARDRLAADMQVYPDQPVFAHALARVLAAAPDDRVRDGHRARMIVEELLTQSQSIELGETIAMTLAELGEYTQAAAVQRDVIAAARQNGLDDIVERMSENLRLYERGQPCRRPFTDAELP